jgi:hypothetical protein
MSPRLLLTFPALAFGLATQVFAQEIPAELQQAKAQYQKEVDFTLRPLRERYLARLETLKRTLAGRGDVRAAVAVQDEIDLLTATINESAIIAKHAGTWISQPGLNRRYSIKTDGSVQWIFDNRSVYASGRMVRNGKEFNFVWDTVDEIDRVTLGDNSLVLEAYQPKAAYPAGQVIAKTTLTRTASNR